MSQALYRKWRPARFAEVVGQEHVTRTLQNAVAAGRIGHAYLFSGPRGTGKTTLARLLAKAANCLDDDLSQRPCNRCRPCLAVNEARFLDLIEIDAASNTGVDDIRDLRDKINFAPSEGRFKVYIIDEVHMLSMAAFNALLKTLEEPPPHAIFVLATTEEHKVPLTIKSRCQQFGFRLLTKQEIVGRLEWLVAQEELSVEPKALEVIAEQGAGSLRDAESLLDQLVTIPGDTVTLERTQLILGTASDKVISDLTDAMLEGDGPSGLRVIHEAFGSGADARQFSRQMVTYLRQLLLLKTAGTELALEVTAEQLVTMNQQAQLADRKSLIEAVKRFNEASAGSSRSWQPRLPMELAFIETLVNRTDESSPDKTLPIPIETESVAESGVTGSPAIVDETEGMMAGSEEQTISADSEPSSTDQQSSSEAQQGRLPGDAPGQLSLKQVTVHWPQVRDRVGHLDKNLPALLASCKPLAMEGQILILGFDYPILKDKFDKNQRNANLVAAALSEMAGVDCAVRTVVTEQYVPPESATTIGKEEFAALAQELGGIVSEG